MDPSGTSSDECGKGVCMIRDVSRETVPEDASRLERLCDPSSLRRDYAARRNRPLTHPFRRRRQRMMEGHSNSPNAGARPELTPPDNHHTRPSTISGECIQHDGCDRRPPKGLHRAVDTPPDLLKERPRTEQLGATRDQSMGMFETAPANRYPRKPPARSVAPCCNDSSAATVTPRAHRAIASTNR